MMFEWDRVIVLAIGVGSYVQSCVPEKASNAATTAPTVPTTAVLLSGAMKTPFPASMSTADNVVGSGDKVVVQRTVGVGSSASCAVTATNDDARAKAVDPTKNFIV